MRKLGLAVVIFSMTFLLWNKYQWPCEGKRHCLPCKLYKLYEKMFFITQYDYAGLFSLDYRKELSWKEKIFCLEEYADESMMKILHKIEDNKERNPLRVTKWNTTEEFVVSGRHFVIKSREKMGVMGNLFRMGLGVTIWNNAAWAKEKGIPVLKPIALVEKRSWNQSNSFVIYLYEGRSCREELSRYNEWCPKIEALKELLYQTGVIYHDFHIGNLVRLEDGKIQFIDIDRLSFCPQKRFSWGFCERMRCEIKKFDSDIGDACLN